MTAQPPATKLGVPDAEIDITADLVTRLLAAQHPDLAPLPVVHAFRGWDNEMFRLGQDLVVRMPRRAVAAGLALVEQTWMPRLPPLPLPIPTPLRTGAPAEDYPWVWSVLPWLPGEPSDLFPPSPDQGAVLGRFFRALHVRGPAAGPRNPYRGVPLAERQVPTEERLERIAARTGLITPAVLSHWRAGLETPVEGETWLQGDPHAKNVLTDAGRFSAVIDWGDMCIGDPASDLCALWMLLPERRSREAAIEAYGGFSEALMRRTKGWVVSFSAMLLDAGLVNDARLAKMGEVTLLRLLDGP